MFTPVTSKMKITKLGNLLDDELFVMMRNSEADNEQARMAWQEFYKRYHKYLWKCCLNQCRKLDGDYVPTAKDLFQSTMQKIYLKSHTYKSRKDSSVKAWISRIAQNEFHDYLKKYYLNFVKGAIPDIPEEFEEANDDEASQKIQDIKFDKLKSLLSQLTEKEYKILITCMTYYQIDNPNAHLPDFVIEELCDEFRITSATIRQIKRRAILKLKAKALSL
jgi:RNA polymerase sigma factor (sigma-70 family)